MCLALIITTVFIEPYLVYMLNLYTEFHSIITEFHYSFVRNHDCKVSPDLHYLILLPAGGG